MRLSSFPGIAAFRYGGHVDEGQESHVFTVTEK